MFDWCEYCVPATSHFPGPGAVIRVDGADLPWRTSKHSTGIKTLKPPHDAAERLVFALRSVFDGIKAAVL